MGAAFRDCSGIGRLPARGDPSSLEGCASCCRRRPSIGNDLLAVARKGEDSIAQVAKDFGVSESGLQRLLKRDDLVAGKRPGR